MRHFFTMTLESADVAERWRAHESRPSQGGREVGWTCWWLPLEDGHVLAAGLGAMLGAATENHGPCLS